VLAAVDLDQDLDAVPAEQLPRPGGALDRVDADRDRTLLGQVPQPAGRGLVDVDRIGDEQVGDPVPGEDLRLTHRGNGQSDRAVLELQPRDPGRLVGLRMRAQRHVVGGRPLRRPAYVVAEPTRVDAQVRRRRRGGH
jgi:hypothetical protein